MQFVRLSICAFFQMKPDMASQLYDDFNHSLSTHVPVERGRFGADMQVSLVNDGPVTIILDTKNR